MGKAFAVIQPARPRDRLEAVLRRALWVVIGALVLAAVGGMIFQFFISPNMLVRNIEISSDVPLSREETVALAGLSPREYFFALNPRALEARLASHPLVKTALVEKIFPETLKLTLVRRRPVAVAYLWDGAKNVPAVFDDEGVLFEFGGRITERDRPVLSGIKLGELAPGAALPRNYRTWLKDLGELERSAAALSALISEIRVVGAAAGNYELILYPVSFPVRVWIGKRINAGALRSLFHALYFMQQEGILAEVDEVDFRSGEAVYRRKGEH